MFAKVNSLILQPKPSKQYPTGNSGLDLARFQKATLVSILLAGSNLDRTRLHHLVVGDFELGNLRTRSGCKPSGFFVFIGLVYVISRRAIPWLIGLSSSLVAVGIFILSCWVADKNRDHEAAGPLRQKLVRQARRLDFLRRLELMSYDLRVERAVARGEELDPSLSLVLFQNGTIDDLHRGLTLTNRLHPLYPRDIYGRVLRELRAEGATAVAFDILMSEERIDDGDWLRQQLAGMFAPPTAGGNATADPSTAEVLDKYPKLASLLAGVSAETGDQMFAREIKASRNTILAVTTNDACYFSFRLAGAQLGAVDSPKDVDGTERRVRAYEDCEFLSASLQNYFRRHSREVLGVDRARRVLKVYRLASDADEAGDEEVPYNEHDEVVIPARRGSFSYKVFDRQRVWHMGIVLAADKLGLDLNNAVIQPDRIILRGTNGVQRIIPADSRGYFLIDWTAAVTEAFSRARVPVTGSVNIFNYPGFPGGIVPLEEVLKLDNLRGRGGTVPSPWKGKLVVVGSMVSGNNMTDVGATPLTPSDALVSTYPNVANSLLKDRFVHRWPLWAEVLMVALWTAGASFITWRLREVLALIVLSVPCVVFVGIAVVVFNQNRIWLPLVHPIVGALAIGFPPMVTYRVFFARRQEKKVLTLFSKMVSPKVVDQLLLVDRLVTGGARRELTVFFADIRGFTEMTDRYQAEAEEYIRQEGLSPAAADVFFEARAGEILETVNEYLTAIADVVKFHDGTLDKYIGDCVMAFWGAPTANSNHALDAVIAAVNAQRAIANLNLERESENRRRETENLELAAKGQPLRPILPILALGSGLNTGNVTAGLMGSDNHLYNFTVFGREVNLASRLEGVSGRGRVVIGEATFLALKKLAPQLADLCIPLEPIVVKGFRNQVQAFEVPWREATELIEPHKLHLPARNG